MVLYAKAEISHRDHRRWDVSDYQFQEAFLFGSQRRRQRDQNYQICIYRCFICFRLTRQFINKQQVTRASAYLVLFCGGQTI